MSERHPIPDAALDDRLGFLGMVGSGKTYGAGTCVERILTRRGRAIIPDPLGVWWGLRLLADGRTPSSHEIVIFGGAHADLPITPHAGALIGETVAGMRESAIIDLSQFETAAAERRFMLAFLDAIYRKTSGEPVHLIFDEADQWAPERIMEREGEAQKLHGMMQTVVRRGRVKGLTSWLISQRPAALSKNVLSQVDGLVAFRLTASQDRKALGLWIEGQADREAGKAILNRLPEKKQGEAVVWLPARGILADVTFPPKETYDSSRAPKRGEKRKAVELKPVDLGALKERLATVEAEVKANDPKALKAEIARLKSDIQKLSVRKTDDNRPDAAAIAKAEERGFEQAKKKLAAAAEIELQTLRAALVQKFGDAIGPLVTILKEELAATRTKRNLAFGLPFTPSPAPAHRQAPSAAPPVPSRAKPAPRAPVNGDGALHGVAQRILDSVAEMEALCRERPTRTLVAIMAGYKNVKSAGFAKALSHLSASGHVTYPDSGTVALADSGRALANQAAKPQTSEEVQRRVIQIMGNTAGKILSELIAVYPDNLEREVLAERSGYQNVKSAGFAKSLSRLSALGFVDYPSPRQARAGDVLFP